MSEHRVLLIENPAQISTDLGRVKIMRTDHEPVYVLPKDIAVLVLHHSTISLTHAVLTILAEHGAIVLCTDNKHMPTAIQLPLAVNVKQVPRLEAQIASRQTTLPAMCWQQLTQARLNGQAFLLECYQRKGVAYLKRLADTVQPGDPANFESQGAREFWKYWLGETHKRHKKGASDYVNTELNFGYAILRSCIARAVVVAGLHPAIGVHHCSSENPYNLVDDLIEPYRFIVEQKVMQDLPDASLNPERKRYLASIVSDVIKLNGRDYRFPVAVQETVDSFVRFINKETRQLSVPSF